MPLVNLEDFQDRALPTLLEYCAIPCLSPAFDHEWDASGHIDAAVELLADWASQRRIADLDVRVHRLVGHTPVIVATIGSTSSGTGTCLFYGHLDKQPPLGDWSDGLGPFTPVRRDNRVYARGVSDDGYAIFSSLLAIEALEAHGVPHSRCVVLIEASEESGSPDLEAHLNALSEHLGRVELLICLDSGALTYDRLWVTSSLRGLVNVELTVSVLERGQHSGTASGVVPSSFRVLRQLIERVEDSATGEVLVPQLYAEIPEVHVAAARAIAEEFGDVTVTKLPVMAGVETMGTDAADRILASTWRPAMSVIGMGGLPEPEHAGNVLRPSTTAVLSFRLPPTVDADEAKDAVVARLTTDVPSSAHVHVSTREDSGWVSPTIAAWLDEALRDASLDAFGHEPGYCGEGGSIPFLASLGRRYPGVQFVATGVLGPGSNAHGIDEMLDLDMAVGVTNAVATVAGAYARHQERP